MSRIKSCFQRLQQDKKKALISYITAGDPHPSKTTQIMHTLAAAGSDLIELGIPFSDPMADGPVIQAACERALRHNTSLQDVIDIVKDFRRQNSHTPVVLMGYQNPIEIFGIDRFASRAHGLVDGVITVDLPPEESQSAARLYQAENIDMIYLLAPTTGAGRIQAIAGLASGFLYYVSFTGITGAGRIDTHSVEKKLQQIKQYATVPVVVGFGVKDAQTAGAVAAYADGVVVGSAIVSILAGHGSDLAASQAGITSLLQDIRGALDDGESPANVAALTAE